MHMSIHIVMCMRIHITIHMSIHMSMHMSMHIYVCRHVCRHVCRCASRHVCRCASRHVHRHVYAADPSIFRDQPDKSCPALDRSCMLGHILAVCACIHTCMDACMDMSIDPVKACVQTHV